MLEPSVHFNGEPLSEPTDRLDQVNGLNFNVYVTYNEPHMTLTAT